MRRRRQISRVQWFIIILLEIVGCLVVGGLAWGVFVSPQPPDFSALFASPTRPTDTPTPTFTPSASPTRTPLPALLEISHTPQPPTATPTQPPTASGTVIDNGEGLNMRAGPGTHQPIVARLLPLTQLTLVARTADGEWLQAIAATGDQGWVASAFVDTTDDTGVLPIVTAQPEGEAGAPTRTASATPTPALATPLPTSPVTFGDYPYILGVSETARQIFQAGQALGNRPDVFSKVGDSITTTGRATEHFLAPIGRGNYTLGEYAYLQPVIDFFYGTEAHWGNSFVNKSLAAGPGWSSWTAINFHAADESVCAQGETPLDCELRMTKPAVALIMLGTNDVADADRITARVYELQMREIIEACMRAGVIPVVSTLPNFHRPIGYRVAIFNDILRNLTDEYDIPLWDYWAALQGLPNDGLSSDGVHPSVAPTSAIDFSPEALQHGMNVRNLTALQALDAIWREVIH